MLEGFFVYLPKIIVQILLDFLYFPLWWYSVGLGRTLAGVGRWLGERFMVLGLGVWLKNLFTPMYGQSDFMGKVISFFIRLFQIFFRSIVMFFFLILAFLAVLFWLALPVAVVYVLSLQIF